MLLRKYTHRRKLNETNIKFVDFWDVIPYDLVIMDQRFGEIRFLTLQDTILKIPRKLVQKVMMLNKLAFRYGLLALDLLTHSYFDSRNRGFPFTTPLKPGVCNELV
jgi:hypothetical protein